MIDWIRVGICAAIAAVLIAAGAAVRSHFIDEGERNVQAKWDATKLADEKLARELADQARAEDNRNRLNAERTADESAKRERERLARLADVQRSADGLRDAIAKLDSDDLSEAARDPRVAAVAARAVAARQLLGSCTARYTSVAGAADRIRDQASGLIDFALTVCHAGQAPITNESNP